MIVVTSEWASMAATPIKIPQLASRSMIGRGSYDW
jgi:hypothetical protein